LQKLKSPIKQTVLVTREMNIAGAARKMLTDAGCRLIEQSFIRIEPLVPEKPVLAEFQWLFFTSPNAVKHFSFYHDVPQGTRYAAVGKGTMAALQQRGIEVDFIGLGKPSDIGRVFATELGKERVLVVCGRGGLRNVQKALNAVSFAECEVYETLSAPVKTSAKADIIAFTSPSNVRAFFEANALENGTRVVSIGHSTESALAEFGVECTVAWESSEQALADTIIGLC